MSLSKNHQHDGGSGAKLDRKELKRPDQFTTSLANFFNEMSKHGWAVMVAGSAVVVAGIVVAILMNQRAKTMDAAKGALFLANQKIEKKLVAMAEAAKPKTPEKTEKGGEPATTPAVTPDSFTFKKMDVDQEFAEGVKAYRDLIAAHGASSAAFEARMTLGGLYLRHGQADQAIPLFQGAVESAAGLENKGYSLLSLGAAFENSGKPADAMAAYEKAKNLGVAPIKGDVLMGIARCQEMLNQKDQAKGTYDQVISQLPNTDYAKTAQTYKSKL